MNVNSDSKYPQSRTGKEEIHMIDLIYAVLKKWWVILIIALAMGAIAYLYTKVTYLPIYTANASMVTKSENDINMVNTYNPILTSDNVLEKVAAESQKTIDPVTMRDLITITSPNGSGVIKIAVTNSDPQTAMDIANAMIRVAPGAIGETLSSNVFTVLDSAKLPLTPEPPNYLKNIALGVIFGIMLGVFIVIGLRILHPKIKGEKEINQNLGLNVLGEIPRNRDFEDKMDIKLIIDPGVGVLFVEAYKYLGIQVKNIAAKKNIKKFLMTSAIDDDGKTWVSFNLSLILASTGSTVLFVEGDVHKSEISNALSDELTIKQSISDLNEGGSDGKDCIAQYPGLELYVLSLKPEDNGNSFNENKFGRMMSQLENQFDYVIIDSPPTLVFSDAAILSKYVDGVIFVVRQGQSGLDVLIKAINNLEGLGADILGCILTDARKAKAHSQKIRKSEYNKNF